MASAGWLRGTGVLPAPQPTVHEVRGQRRHAARLKAFADIKSELKEFVFMEVQAAVCHAIFGGRGDALGKIASEMEVRANIEELAGQGFDHSLPAYMWARENLPPGDACRYRRVVRQRNAAAHRAFFARGAGVDPCRESARGDARPSARIRGGTWCIRV